MAKIPQLQQTSIFQPQTVSAPTQGFQAVANLFTEAQEVTQKLGDEQRQADKVVGSNQLQSTMRSLQEDAIQKFPGDYKSQQEFFNKGANSFLSNFIPGTNLANRGYFKAVSKNILSEANFGYARNVESQNLRNQKTSFNNIYNQNLINTVKAIRNSNSALAQDNIGHMMQSLDNAEKGSILSPSEKSAYQQKMLMAVQVAGAKTHIDGALAHGGVDAANAKFREIVSDPNNSILADPKTASSFISELRSYKNAITSGLKASQSANKDKIRDIINNTRLTGIVNPDQAAQFDIQDQVANAMTIHNKTWEIFTTDPLNQEKALSDLDLSDPNQVAIKKTFDQFERQYNKDPMNFLLNQIGKTQFGTSLANANPQQLQQMRSTAIQIEEQRQDLQVKPATNAEIQPVVQTALSGNTTNFINSYNAFNNRMGKYSQSGLIQLGKSLVKNGVDSSVEDIGYLENKNGLVAQNILAGSTGNLNDFKTAAASKLGISTQTLSKDLRSHSSDIINNRIGFFSPTSAKFISSLRNGAGNKQGLVLAELQKNMSRYAVSTISNNKNSSILGAMQQYIGEFTNSFNYMKTRNGQYIRIPMEYNERPLDQNKIIDSLKKFQSNVKMSDVDLSNVQTSVFESPELAQQRWWNSVGSYNHWVTSSDGESYILMGGDNIPLFRKGTKMPIRVRISDIIGGTQ